MEVDNKTAVAAGGILATVVGWCVNKLYGGLSHRINNAQNAANTAAKLAADVEQRRREDVTALHERIGEHIEKDHVMHDKVLTKLGDIHADVQRALGDRPTREEMREFFQAQKS